MLKDNKHAHWFYPIALGLVILLPRILIYKNLGHILIIVMAIVIGFFLGKVDEEKHVSAVRVFLWGIIILTVLILVPLFYKNPISGLFAISTTIVFFFLLRVVFAGMDIIDKLRLNYSLAHTSPREIVCPEEKIIYLWDDDDIAIMEEARKSGQLIDGTFRCANFQGIDLLDTDLSYADFSRAHFEGVDLTGAILTKANLSNIYLVCSDLDNANLQSANLENADLWQTSLLNANLQEANLIGANLGQAILQNANLWYALFDETTTLPDGTKWTLNTDLERFTDPNHPNFWQHPRFRTELSE